VEKLSASVSQQHVKRYVYKKANDNTHKTAENTSIMLNINTNKSEWLLYKKLCYCRNNAQKIYSIILSYVRKTFISLEAHARF